MQQDFKGEKNMHQNTTTNKVSKSARYVNRLVQQDLDIMHTLYMYRALTTQQIQTMSNLGKWYVYKKLSALCNSGYTTRNEVAGYIVGQRRQGNYFRITEKGISCLREYGYEVNKTANELRVTKFYLPFLLTMNDIMLELQEWDWKFADSREVKAKYQLNRSSSIQGSLTNKFNTEYICYVVMKSISAMNLAKIDAEIRSEDFAKYIMFTRTELAYQKVINQLLHSNSVAVSKELKIFPQVFGVYYLSTYQNDKQFFYDLEKFSHEKYSFKTHSEIIEDMYDDAPDKTPLTFKTNFESNLNLDGLTYIAEHNGKEKYVVNMLDTDLVKVYNISHYTVEKYNIDKRPVLVITNEILESTHRDLLHSTKHVEYYTLKQSELQQIIETR